MPTYPEFSVAHMLHNKYVDDNTVTNFFPDDPLKMDRAFFWSIWLKE